MPGREPKDPAPGRHEVVRELRARVDYLRDLGIFDLYRREDSPALDVSVWLDVAPQQAPAAASAPPTYRSERTASPVTPAAAARPETPEPIPFDPALSPNIEDPVIAPRKASLLPVAFTPGPLIAPTLRAAALESLRREIGPDCTRCPLGTAGRHKVVFGDGDPNARLLFVGEGPGADEDMQGIPFVGRAGQLLNNMITAMGLAREQVYIANIVKCRPPKNRVPEPEEAVTCSQFLFRQIDILRPQVIVALGATAATYLLGVRSPLASLRGRVHSAPHAAAGPAPAAKLIVTYHPAYLLRDPSQKKAAWMDLQLAMRELG